MSADENTNRMLDQITSAGKSGQSPEAMLQALAALLATNPEAIPADRRAEVLALASGLAGQAEPGPAAEAPGGDARMKALKQTLETARPGEPLARDPAWLWAEPMGVPEAEDMGPALSDAEITAWEEQHGVALPPILNRAYRQQDGGYIRDNEREVSLNRLANIEPVEEGFLDDLADEDAAGLDAARLFYLGGDATGATVLLHYGEPGSAVPAVYAYHTDGGSLERIAATVDELFPGESE